MDARRAEPARWAPAVRWLSGASFVVFGAGKFTAYSQEVDSFASYGLPAPEVFVYLVGALELLGGLLLIVGLLTRPVALVLAANMAGAIVVSGIVHGEVLPSLTLAPALLAAMIYLLWAGPGSPALDRRLVHTPKERT